MLPILPCYPLHRHNHIFQKIKLFLKNNEQGTPFKDIAQGRLELIFLHYIDIIRVCC